MKEGDNLQDAQEHDAVLRKQKLREEGLIEIPMTIDASRYFIGNIRWMDIVYTSPFVLISILIILALNKTGYLNTTSFIFSFLPPILVLTAFWVKHPDRKNISFITTIFWRIKHLSSVKNFELTKERKENMKEDIRSQLGIYNIANDCFETLDNRLIKVIEVSSVNLTGMSFNDRDRTYKAYQNFLNDFPFDAFPMQINTFSKPINLKNYLNWVQKELGAEQNNIKRMFVESYINKANEIQKSKNMVSKARYVIISEKIGSDKEKALDKISENAERMVSGIENMISDKNKLHAKILDNEKLFELIYSSIDYENAQISHSLEKRTEPLNTPIPITLGKDSFNSIQEELREEKEHRIV